MKVQRVPAAWSILLLLALPALAPAGGGVTPPVGGPQSPATGVAGVDPWWLHWSRDGDGDRIDDAIVRLDALSARLDDAALKAALAVGHLDRTVHVGPDGPRFDVFVRYTRTPGAADADAVAALTGGTVRLFPLAEAVHAQTVALPTIRLLLTLDGVAGIELERPVRALLETATKSSLVIRSDELGLGARERWRVTGQGVTVAVLDTGIDQEHTAFVRDNFVGGYDATIPTGSLAGHLDPVNPLPDPVGNVSTDTPLGETDPDDDSQGTHGTHVAGIVVGKDPEDGNRTGVAPGSRYLDVKVLASVPVAGSLGTSSMPLGVGSMVIEGLEFVARFNRGETYLGDPGDDTVDVVTMSLGEFGPDEDGTSVLSHAVNRLVDTGVVVVAAAGNCGPDADADCEREGNNTVVAPGAAKKAITVGALDDAGTVGFVDDQVALFSSIGPNGGEPKPNLVAYGVDILSPRGEPGFDAAADSGYSNVSGTSMATPIVAGVVALMLEAQPDMQPDTVKRLLMATARDIDDEGWDARSGAGAANAYFAVGAALGFLDVVTTRLDETGHDVNETVQENETPEPENRTVQNQPPVVDFEFGPGSPLVGENVVFADKTLDPERDALVAWTWSFGDGQTEKGKRVAHAYERPGTYKVGLSVADVEGSTGYRDKTITVVLPPGEKEESPAPGVAAFAFVALVLLAWTRARRHGRRSD